MPFHKTLVKLFFLEFDGTADDILNDSYPVVPVQAPSGGGIVSR